MHPAETLGMLRCCSQLGMPEVGAQSQGWLMQLKSLLHGAGECQDIPDQDIPCYCCCSPGAGLVAVARGAPASAWLSSAVWGHPKAQQWAKWVAWPWAEPALAESPAPAVRASALGEAENNQSRQRDFDSLLLVLITQECLVCGHCSAV